MFSVSCFSLSILNQIGSTASCHRGTSLTESSNICITLKLFHSSKKVWREFVYDTYSRIPGPNANASSRICWTCWRMTSSGVQPLWGHFVGSRPVMISLPDVPCCYSVTRIILAHSSSLLHIRRLLWLLADSSFSAFSSKNDDWPRQLAG